MNSVEGNDYLAERVLNSSNSMRGHIEGPKTGPRLSFLTNGGKAKQLLDNRGADSLNTTVKL